MVFDIVSVGSAVVDVFVHTDVARKKDFLLYPVGEKMLIENLRFDVGGGGTNTAVAFSRFGLKTGCVSALGEDNNSKLILDLLKKEGVKFLGPIKKGEMSGYSVILDSSDKDRTILTYKGVNDNISIDDVSSFKTRWLYFSSLLNESFKTQKKLAKRLVDKGARLAINPSSYHIENESISGLLKMSTILILNLEEAELLCKKKKLKGDPLLALGRIGPKVVVITDNKGDVRCLHEGKEYKIRPHKNVKVVERTGAGDAFASGFVAGFVCGKDIDSCLALALEESESVIRHMGAKNNLIRRKLK